MIYLLSGILAYLVLGFVLTRSVFKAPSIRMRFSDVVLGAIFMPILVLLLVLFDFFEEMWKRLLIALDFDPPEEMRAGPQAPADPDSPG